MKTNIPDTTDFVLPPQPWGLEAAKAVVAELKRTGFTVAHFARTHNVSAYKILRCQRIVDEARPESVKKGNPLLSVRIREAAFTQEALPPPIFEIKTTGGLMLKFPQDICPQALAPILRNLLEALCWACRLP